MTKTRDEVVEIMQQGYQAEFMKPKGLHEDGMYGAYDALIAAGVIPQWRPIEEAPKDGRKESVLLYGDKEGFVVIGHWSNKRKRWQTDERLEYPEPTDFMPLPTPPQNKGGDE